MTIKQAVEYAVEGFREVFPENSEALRLEEVDHSKSGSRWRVTFSVPNGDYEQELQAQRQALDHPLVGPAPVATRKFKSVLIDEATGKVLSIRNV